MAPKHLQAACVSAAIVAFASVASAQVEPTTVIEESQSAAPKPALAPLAPLPPRRDETVFGLGVAATVTGGVAVPVGGLLMLASFMQGFGDGMDCAARLGRECPASSSDSLGAIGAVTMVSGLVLLAVGIPMIVVGGKRVPKDVAFDPLVVRF